jgi:ribosomal protein L29
MKEFVNKTEKELTTMLAEKRAGLRDFRFAISGSKNRNVKAGKALRQDVARILTVMNAPKTK